MADPGHLEEGLDGASPWYLWGPYVAERAWGTVREDYSADGDAWSYFPHDHARSRAYRWNEDGMAGLSDVFGRLCLGLALWNGRDPILKERMFGLANSEGNHGEDAKDYWWYLDALPSSAWLRWRYHYPQAEFPYEDLLRVNRERSKLEGEYELLDTGVFDAGYWVVEVDYAKADPTDILMRITIKNAGPAADTLHVLPTLWFRNTWSWGDGTPRPSIIATDQGRSLFATHTDLGDYALDVGPDPDGNQPTLLFCENETNLERLYGQPPTTAYPKDGINDHVVHGAATVAHGAGTKAAAWYQVTLEPGASAEIRLRLRPTGDHVASDPLGAAFGELMHTRQIEADAFYAGLARDGMTADEALIMRQAFAGMLWCKQFYAYNVTRWLAGDTEAPPAERRHGRNAHWRHVDTLDILSMPDSWEYPWFAAWDLAFHAITLAHIDPAFAKYQLLVLCREWFQHPNGALPAYEWSFDDVNPPVHAIAAIRVWEIDGRRDTAFLQRIFHKLLLNFTWWLNRQDSSGDDLFSGGFLGLDNLSAFDRSNLPFPGRLEQSDATAWMFAYCMSMLRMASILAEHDPSYRDLMITFLEHGVRIAGAINQQGLWDESDAFYYDALHLPDGTSMPLRIHSMIGLLPVLPATSVPRARGPARRGVRQALLALPGECRRHRRVDAGTRIDHHDARRGSLPAEPAAARLAPTRAPRGPRRRRVPLAARPARAVATPPRPAVQRDGRGRHRDRRLRARRVDDRPVRRELQLARSGLVPGQLPVHRVAAALGRRPRRDVHGRVPDGFRSPASPARRRARPGHAAGRHLVARCRGSAARVPRLRSLRDRPGMA